MERTMRIMVFTGLLIATTTPFAQQAATRTAADVVTVVGCVQHEAEYRAQVSDGRGGAAGSGVGVGNEFVLRSARSVMTEDLKPRTMPAGFEEVYSVTGNLERELVKALGQQVAVSGYVEVAVSAGTERVRDLPRLNAVGWHVVGSKCNAPGPTKP